MRGKAGFQVVALEVAGSSPVSHPTPSTTYRQASLTDTPAGTERGRNGLTRRVILVALLGVCGAACDSPEAPQPAATPTPPPTMASRGLETLCTPEGDRLYIARQFAGYGTTQSSSVAIAVVPGGCK